MQRLNDAFTRFAIRSQIVIGRPFHFSLFLIVVALWLPWTASRSFDTFSGLLMNDATTLAEYGFAVLTLRAADTAEATAAHISARVDQLAEELAQLLEAHHSHIVSAVRRDGLA
jgi:hypothetical protein